MKRISNEMTFILREGIATSSRQTSRNAKPNTERKFSEQSRSCDLCSASHPLQDCEGFKKNSLEERHSFIMTNKLCFGCLGKGHMSKDCRRTLTCQKCNRSHPAVFHREWEDREEQTSDVNQAVSNCSSASSQSSKNKDVTIYHIPYTIYHIPEAKVAKKWPHLRRIAEKLQPHQGEVDVGLRIGCNCPKAIKPREVILGKGEDL